MALQLLKSAGQKFLGKKDEAPKKSGPQKAFDEFKHWITSPGGLITIGLFIITVWYIHHRTEPKK